jgi:FtsX-like permease family
MSADDPPRLALRLLRRALPPGVRGETILGDLLEDFRERLGRRSLRALWFWRQTLSLAVRYAWRRERDVGRPMTEGSASMLDQVWQDVRYAARSHAKTPSFTLALGATARDVIGMIVGQGLGTTLIGVLAGLAGATALSSSIQGLLFGVKPIDPPTLVGVVFILVTVASAACYIPARRATRMDPSSALRSD